MLALFGQGQAICLGEHDPKVTAGSAQNEHSVITSLSFLVQNTSSKGLQQKAVYMLQSFALLQPVQQVWKSTWYKILDRATLLKEINRVLAKILKEDDDGHASRPYFS